MKKNFLNNVWKESDFILSNNTDNIQLSAEKFNNLIGRIASVGPLYYYALKFSNSGKVTMEQQNLSLESFFGIPPNEMNLEILMSKIHPDDIPFIQQAEVLVISAIQKYYHKNLLNFKSSYCFRIKDKTENYKLILHQMMPIELDNNGKFLYSINIHTDIEHITTINQRTVSLFGFNGMPSFIGIDPYNENVFDDKKYILTTRETEILRYLASGHTSKEVSEKLHISEHTVKTHKRNILSKTKCKNITEVVSKSINEGLI